MPRIELSQAQTEALDKMNQTFSKFFEEVSTICPMGRCLAICQTKLQEAHFWATQSFSDPTSPQNQSGVVIPKTVVKANQIIKGNNN